MRAKCSQRSTGEGQPHPGVLLGPSQLGEDQASTMAPRRDSPLKIRRWVQTPMPTPKARMWPVRTEAWEGCGLGSQWPCSGSQPDMAETSSAEAIPSPSCFAVRSWELLRVVPGPPGCPPFRIYRPLPVEHCVPRSGQTRTDTHRWEPPSAGASQRGCPLHLRPPTACAHSESHIPLKACHSQASSSARARQSYEEAGALTARKE